MDIPEYERVISLNASSDPILMTARMQDATHIMRINGLAQLESHSMPLYPTRAVVIINRPPQTPATVELVIHPALGNIAWIVSPKKVA